MVLSPRKEINYISKTVAQGSYGSIVYVADTGNHCIRRICNVTVTTVAGVPGFDDNAPIPILAHRIPQSSEWSGSCSLEKALELAARTSDFRIMLNNTSFASPSSLIRYRSPELIGASFGNCCRNQE
jgi:hypothetical protein